MTKAKIAAAAASEFKEKLGIPAEESVIITFSGLLGLNVQTSVPEKE